MGRLVEQHAAEHACEIAGIAELDRPIADVLSAAGPVDVAIDFSQPDAVAGNLGALATLRTSVVIGTTGWHLHEAGMRHVAERAGIGVFAAANFSIGMHVFAAVVGEAARRFGAIEGVGAAIHETHHAAKKDAPSGTALMLQNVMTGAGYQRPVDM